MGCLLGSSMVGLMATSSMRPHAVSPRSAVPITPAHVASHCWPVPPWELLKHSKAGLAQSLWGPGPSMHQVLFEPSELLWWVWGLILNVISPAPSPIVLLGLLLCPWHVVSFLKKKKKKTQLVIDRKGWKWAFFTTSRSGDHEAWWRIHAYFVWLFWRKNILIEVEFFPKWLQMFLVSSQTFAATCKLFTVNR